MTKRGRVPKPTALKKAEGTYQPCRDPFRGEEPEIAPTKSGFECPAELDEDERAIWLDVVPKLQEIGTLAKTDTGMLEGYCSKLALWKKYRDVAKRQPFVKGRPNPAAVEARKLWVLIERDATALGLSYAARARAGGGGAVGASSEEKQRIAETEAFLFENAPFTVVQGGKA